MCRGSICDGLCIPEGIPRRIAGFSATTREAAEEIVLGLLEVVIPQSLGDKFIRDLHSAITGIEGHTIPGFSEGLGRAVHRFSAIYGEINDTAEWSATGNRSTMDCGWRLVMRRGLVSLEDGSSLRGDGDGIRCWARGEAFPCAMQDVRITLYLGRDAVGNKLSRTLLIGELECLASYLTLHRAGLERTGISYKDSGDCVRHPTWLGCMVPNGVSDLLSTSLLRKWWYYLAAELLLYEKEIGDEFAVVFNL